jgi:hypothetical protein
MVYGCAPEIPIEVTTPADRWALAGIAGDRLHPHALPDLRQFRGRFGGVRCLLVAMAPADLATVASLRVYCPGGSDGGQ